MKSNKKAVRLFPAISAMLVGLLIMITVGQTAAFAAAKSTDSSFPANSLGLEVKAAILIDADTGQVLFQMNQDEARPPASMTKMMTEYMVLEEIAAGRLKWDDIVTVTEEAASTPADGSQIYLAAGDKHTVKDLYIAMAVGSANDATIALADRIGSTEEGFVKKMNETAKSLGLNSANFTSATGLKDTTVISAADLAKFASILLKKHPEFLDFSKLPSYKFRERDKAPMVNWNWMLASNKAVPSLKKFAYDGLDGMKTGYISAAGYCFTSTAKRGNMRLISVVMGAKTINKRFTETAKLLDYGFNNFEQKTVVAPKTVVKNAESVKIKKGVSKEVPIMTASDVTFLVKKGSEPAITQTKVTLKTESELVAPIANGQEVGSVTYTYKDAETGKSVDKTVKLITSKEVEKASWWRLLFRAIGSFFGSLFKGIVNLF
ncbi:D-alanyl-D-alanine carboxypeptidase [Paenibacillus baekrokdamisoli]|uniref:serine-type D-Ala-D-Ala carboxypeptidase n=1 Tax=Paenibacillus baekrokdamisoli TaxID=1712516 RepID=A0A3G9IXQ4_9BACL|nr:D-alanyl-D-alanine carboxypeptidase family protein [Paenibacillus baekrokdamisoli]BBH23306.1 D-alanyl-D-alanine carboxypeptidase [Paenibacillus baekrokdamisoli]